MKPYLNAVGSLVIPTGSDPRYHWWAGGQSVKATLRELEADPETFAHYTFDTSGGLPWSIKEE